MDNPIDISLDADLELLGATARRHIDTLDPRVSVHICGTINALIDPLVPPRLTGVDDTATTDLAEVLRAVRGRLQHAAQHAGSVQRTIAIGLAARELTHALATLATLAAGPAAPQSMAERSEDPAQPGWAGW